MEKNAQGQIAIVYRQPIPQKIKIGDTTYFFDVKRAISLAWVNEEHVVDILKIIKTCCGGSKHTAYSYATDGQVRVWSGLGR